MSETAVDATGRLETRDSAALITGDRRPPFAALEERGEAEEDGHEPSRPSPRRSQATEFTILVTWAAGADGIRDVIWSTTPPRSDEAGEAAGRLETKDSAALITGWSIGSPLLRAAEVGKTPLALD